MSCGDIWKKIKNLIGIIKQKWTKFGTLLVVKIYLVFQKTSTKVSNNGKCNAGTTLIRITANEAS